mmetsp:Transcript_17695/g.38174  ORF Transcript_17695/g.38174 Transcript_17695/m.38174 type:complete len:80 (+) Transcript_17695:1359-1598(+)
MGRVAVAMSESAEVGTVAHGCALQEEAHPGTPMEGAPTDAAMLMEGAEPEAAEAAAVVEVVMARSRSNFGLSISANFID